MPVPSSCSAVESPSTSTSDFCAQPQHHHTRAWNLYISNVTQQGGGNKGWRMYVSRVCACAKRTGAAARVSLRRDRPVEITSPAFHACGSTSLFRARCCHSSQQPVHPPLLVIILREQCARGCARAKRRAANASALRQPGHSSRSRD